MTPPIRGDRRWSSRCYINSVEYRLAGFPDIIFGAGERGTCRLDFAEPLPSGLKNSVVEVDIGLLDFDTFAIDWYRAFTGYLSYDPNSLTRYNATVIDASYKLQRATTQEFTWSNRPVEDCITDLLTDAGLATAEIGAIDEPGTIYNIGSVEDEVIATGEKIVTVLRRIYEYAGLTWTSTPAGTIRHIYDINQPASGASVTLSEGNLATLTLLDDTRGIQTPTGPILPEDSDIVYSATVTGKRLADDTQWRVTVEANLINSGEGETLNTELAQTENATTAIARRLVRRGGADNRTYTVETRWMPDYAVGNSVVLNIPRYGVNSEPVRIARIALRRGIVTLTLQAGRNQLIGDSAVDLLTGDNGEGGAYLGGLPPAPPPVPNIAVEIDHEDSVSGSIYTVHASGAGSTTSGGSLTYAWNVTGSAGSPTLVSPNTSSETVVYRYDTLTGATLTLDVSDGSTTVGQTVALDDPDIQVKTRIVTATMDGSLYVWYDPDESPIILKPGAGDITASPRYCDGEYIYAGDANGKIWRWNLDALGNAAATEIGDFGSSITDIFVCEGFISAAYTQNVLVAYGNNVAWSTNAEGTTPTWASNTFGAAVQSVSISPFAPEQYTVVFGRTLQTSLDGGATWTTDIVDGTAGALFRDFGSSAPGILIANDGAPQSTALIEVGGAAITWSDALSGNVTSITPLADSRAVSSFYVSTDTGYIYLASKSGGNYTVTQLFQVGGANNDIARITRDGLLAGQVYVAVQSGTGIGVWKQFGDTGAVQLAAATTSATRVGYAQYGAAIDAISARILLITDGAGSGNNGVYVIDAPAKAPVLKNSGLPSSVDWTGQSIAANPFDKDEWLLALSNTANNRVTISGSNTLIVESRTYGPLWYTNDAGDTWTELVVPLSTFPAGSTGRVWAVAWSQTVPGEWCMTVSGVSSNRFIMPVTGTNGNAASIVVNGTLLAGDGNDLISGTDDLGTPEWIIKAFAPDGELVIFKSATPTIPSGTISNPAKGTRYPGTARRVIWTNSSDQLLGTEDYRTLQPGIIAASGTFGRDAAITIDDRLYIGIRNSGMILEVLDDPFSTSTPNTAVVAGASQNSVAIGVDQQNRTIVGALRQDQARVVLWDGTQETEIDISVNTLSEEIEIVTL